MSGINVGRWLIGGVAAAVVMFVIEGAGSMLYLTDMQAAMTAHGLSAPAGTGLWAMTLLFSLIAGLALVFFYAAARTRFGPGPKTALIVGVAMWFGSYLLSVMGYGYLGLFPSSMLVMWGAVGLVEVLIASLVGAWLYREA